MKILFWSKFRPQLHVFTYFILQEGVQKNLLLVLCIHYLVQRIYKLCAQLRTTRTLKQTWFQFYSQNGWLWLKFNDSADVILWRNINFTCSSASSILLIHKFCKNAIMCVLKCVLRANGIHNVCILCECLLVHKTSKRNNNHLVCHHPGTYKMLIHEVDT